jgi:hypothetical protein
VNERTFSVDRLIWATRGRSWVFRFLLDGGFGDPLQPYDQAFGDMPEDSVASRLVGSRLALRFPDPEGRRDAAGRVIPHEFVVWGDVSTGVESTGDGQDRIWPIVRDAYASIWDSPTPPPQFRFDPTSAQVRRR